MSIVITGASGHLGRATAELVLGRMPAQEVILTTRHPEEISDLAAAWGGGPGGPISEGRRRSSGRSRAGRSSCSSAPTTVGARVGPAPGRHRGGRKSGDKPRRLHVVPEPGRGEPGRGHCGPPGDRGGRCARAAWLGRRCATAFYAEYQVPTGTQAVATGRLVHNNGDGENGLRLARGLRRRCRRRSEHRRPRGQRPTISPGRSRWARTTWRRS